jgi:hypothetical protein
MAVRISELDELSVDLSQLDELPIVDLSAGDTKKVTVANLLNVGISGAPSSFIDLGKLNQSSTTKLGAVALDNTGVASGTYGGAATVAQFIVNPQGLITSASGVAIVIAASSVTDLATVATSGTYASLSGLPTLGTLSSQDAGSVVISGGTISGVTFISGNVTISGGTISGTSQILQLQTEALERLLLPMLELILGWLLALTFSLIVPFFLALTLPLSLISQMKLSMPAHRA